MRRCWRHAAAWSAACLLLLVLVGCAGRGASGQVRVRVTDGTPSLAEFDRVVVEIHSVGLHTDGQPRDVGWVELPVTTRVIDLKALGASGVTVADGPLPPGRYDRVRVEVEQAHGEVGGRSVPIRNIVEPIYLPAPATNGSLDIRVELIVMPLMGADDREPFAVYTKGVGVERAR